MTDRYFLALIPPPPLYDECVALKEHFRDYYQSKAALRSPPHITLHMPFEWKSRKESRLKEQLERLSGQLSPVRIELNGFGCFAPRVIYIHVDAPPELLVLQRQITRFCRTELNLLNADYRDLPFHPHLTIAFRDLKKDAFPNAWAEFQDRFFQRTFQAEKLALLKHDGSKWLVEQEFPMHRASTGL